MDFDSFVKKYEGKETDIDGAAGVQCVDLSKAYLLDVFGIPMFSVTSAKNYYEKFSSYPELKGKFVRIPNTADFIPMKGVEFEQGRRPRSCGDMHGRGDYELFLFV